MANSFWWFHRELCRVSCFHFYIVTGFTWKNQTVSVGYLRQGSFQRKKMALGYLYALCVWIGLLHPSLGTGFVYRFPGIALQRQRIHSEQGSSTGPPGAGSSLRCAHSGGLAAIYAHRSVFSCAVCFVFQLLSVRIASLLLRVLGTGVSTLLPGQCPAKYTMGLKPQCRGWCRAAGGPDRAAKSSGRVLQHTYF